MESSAGVVSPMVTKNMAGFKKDILRGVVYVRGVSLKVVFLI